MNRKEDSIDIVYDEGLKSKVKTICFFAAGVYAFRLANNPYLPEIIVNNLTHSIENMLFYSINYLFLPPALFLYYYNHKIGWMFLTLYFVNIALSGLAAYSDQIQNIDRDSIHITYLVYQFYDLALPSLFFIALIFYNYSKAITRYYGINNTTSLITLIISILLTLYHK